MFIFLSILILLAALLLTLVVVIQNSKGGGLAAGFDTSNKYMGVRKTTDFLEKATWWLAGALLVLSVASSYFIHSSNVDDTQRIQQEIQKNKPVLEQNLEQLPTLGGEAAPAAPEQGTPTPAEATPTQE